jgi:PLP dependent protein
VSVTQHTLEANLLRIRACIARAAEKSGRTSKDITLIAATKTQTPETIRIAYDAGLRHFGENRVQEWEGKRRHLEDLAASWHLIGHLQRNKVSRARRLFNAIDSVDSLALAQKLDQESPESPESPRLPILIEIKMDPVVSKTGLDQQQLPETADAILSMPHLELRGLMCVPPFFEASDQGRVYFQRMRELRDALERRYQIPFPVLSMGMSHDFETAIEEGSTQIRLGTALFGSRPLA